MCSSSGEKLGKKTGRGQAGCRTPVPGHRRREPSPTVSGKRARQAKARLRDSRGGLGGPAWPHSAEGTAGGGKGPPAPGGYVRTRPQSQFEAAACPGLCAQAVLDAGPRSPGPRVEGGPAPWLQLRVTAVSSRQALAPEGSLPSSTAGFIQLFPSDSVSPAASGDMPVLPTLRCLRTSGQSSWPLPLCRPVCLWVLVCPAGLCVWPSTKPTPS